MKYKILPHRDAIVSEFTDPIMDAALTFQEIADRLGSTKKNIAMTYYRAMEKLRNRPDQCEKLRVLIQERQRIREGAAA